MKNISVLGIDISKNTFEACGLDARGNKVYKKSIKRKDLITTILQLKADVVVMEACGGSNHWSRVLKLQGVNIKLISPQYVKPFVKTNKNDANDAEAIAEAGSRGHMYFVTPKNLEQQDIQSLLRIRERLKINRVKLINEMRGLLQEYGIIISSGANKIYKEVPLILDDYVEKGLTEIMGRAVNRMYVELKNIDTEMNEYDNELNSLFMQNEEAKRIERVPGVGILSALAIISSVGDVSAFRNGRHFSAYLGLVPRQHSSGGKEKLLGISKRGNVFVRTCLIHGARAVMSHVDKKTDPRSMRLKAMKERRGMNRTCVALANKNARVIWALLNKKTNYNEKIGWTV